MSYRLPNSRKSNFATEPERQQVAAYTTLVRELGEGDPTTRRLLLDILADTERHASELADYLKNTSEMRP